jgi:hypothetical protein
MFHIVWLQVNCVSYFCLTFPELDLSIYLYQTLLTCSNNSNTVKPPEDIFGKHQHAVLIKRENMLKG